MPLSSEDVKRLEAPFKIHEHEYNDKGFVYIAEGATARRLSEVDPGWELIVVNVWSREGAHNTHVRLTVNGTVRDGVGTSRPVISKQSGDETNEPEKGAATDAFRRAARLFGIGQYLLDAPKGEQAFKNWYHERYVAQPKNGAGTAGKPQSQINNERRVGSETPAAPVVDEPLHEALVSIVVPHKNPAGTFTYQLIDDVTVGNPFVWTKDVSRLFVGTDAAKIKFADKQPIEFSASGEVLYKTIDADKKLVEIVSVKALPSLPLPKAS